MAAVMRPILAARSPEQAHLDLPLPGPLELQQHHPLELAQRELAVLHRDVNARADQGAEKMGRHVAPRAVPVPALRRHPLEDLHQAPRDARVAPHPPPPRPRAPLPARSPPTPTSPAGTSPPPVADSPMQRPTIRDPDEHPQPRVAPDTRFWATEAGVMPIAASRSREIAFSRVAPLTSKTASTSPSPSARKSTFPSPTPSLNRRPTPRRRNSSPPCSRSEPASRRSPENNRSWAPRRPRCSPAVRS